MALQMLCCLLLLLLVCSCSDSPCSKRLTATHLIHYLPFPVDVVALAAVASAAAASAFHPSTGDELQLQGVAGLVGWGWGGGGGGVSHNSHLNAFCCIECRCLL